MPDLSENFKAVYDKLHTLAEQYFRRHSSASTLQATALVHEVYLRFAALDMAAINDSEHLMAVAATSANRAGCTFCMDLQLAEAVKARIGKDRFRELFDFESSTAFSEREKAALAYVEAVHASLHVPDAIFDRLRKYFDEREIIDIVWTCAVERYLNGMALPLRIGSDQLAA